MWTLIWIIQCLIAAPACLLGFIYEALSMGFRSGRSAAEVVYQWHTCNKIQQRVDLANTALAKARE